MITSLVIDAILNEAVKLSSGREVEYGSQSHLLEIDRIIDDIVCIKVGLRKGPERNKYRKELYRLQSAIEALRYLRKRAERSAIINGLINEGGLKIKDTSRKMTLTPTSASQAIEIYLGILEKWNKFLPKDKQVKPLRPVGSVSYYRDDIGSQNANQISYGDIDYLVQFPFDGEFEGNELERKSLQNKAKGEMESLFSTFLNQLLPDEVDIEETLRSGSSPLMVVLKMPDGSLVQVDTVPTFEKYLSWMGFNEEDPQNIIGRYTPERGLKGYTIGNLYKALADYLTLSIGTEGVQARVRDGQRVSPRLRKDVEIHDISTDIENFLIDIAKYIGGDDIEIHPLLFQNPGLSREGVRILDFSKGIRGLALTLEAADIENSLSMLNSIKVAYDEAMRANVERKRDRGLSEDDFIKLLDLNEKASTIVTQGLGI